MMLSKPTSPSRPCRRPRPSWWACAAELQLAPPPQEAQTIALPTVGLSIAFPPEPERFVGRLQPMLRASQALARRSPKRGVLFHGMPGCGQDRLRAGADLPPRAWPLPGLRLAPRPRGRQRHRQRPVQPDAGHPDPAQRADSGADHGAGRSPALPAIHAAAPPRAAEAEVAAAGAGQPGDAADGQRRLARSAVGRGGGRAAGARRPVAGRAHVPARARRPGESAEGASRTDPRPELCRERPAGPRAAQPEAAVRRRGRAEAGAADAAGGAGAPQAAGAGGRPGRRPAGAGGAGGRGGERAGGPGRCAGRLLRRGRAARGRDAAAGRRLRAGVAGLDGRRRRRPDAHGRAALRLPLPPGAGRSAAGHPGGQLEGLPDQAGGGTRRRGRGAGRAGAGAAGGAGRAGSRRAGGRGAPGHRSGASREAESDAG